jgi:hypothetical protein
MVLVIPDEGDLSRVRLLSIKLDKYYTLLLLDDPKPIMAHWVPSSTAPPGNSFPCIGSERDCPRCGVFTRRVEFYSPVLQHSSRQDERGETKSNWVEKVLHLPPSARDQFAGPEKVGHVHRVTRRRMGNDWRFVIDKSIKAKFEWESFDVYAALEEFFFRTGAGKSQPAANEESATATIPFRRLTPYPTPPIRKPNPTPLREAKGGGA